MAKTTKQESSAEIVSSVDDLLMQILLGLPIKALLRFKSVSKHWHSLISSPAFAILCCRHGLKPASGLFLRNRCLYQNPEFEFINFDIHNPISTPFSMLESSKGPSAEAVNILQSCNGLFLCSCTQLCRPWRKYHLIFNPTTKQSMAIPRPSKKTIHGIGLAFDPVKSPAYKVVCILNSDSVPGSYQIKIYSSETRSWRISGEPFIANHDFKHGIGVYWNGAINWLCRWHDKSMFFHHSKICYFNIDEERLGEMAPPHSSGHLTYFGESHGHLHVVDIWSGAGYELEINELKSDYSGWYVKFRIQLAGLGGAFPFLDKNDLRPYNIGCVLSVVAVMRCEKEEHEFVVLQIPGKAIRYDLAANTFHKLCDFVDGGVEEAEGRLRFHDFCAHQFFESLSCVC